VYTEVYDGSQLVDNYVSPLGIRSVSWSATAGFSINGQHLWIHGADVHQTHAGWGDATANTGSERDVKLIHDCGMNFIRGSHYPHAPAFCDACDKLPDCHGCSGGINPFPAAGIDYAWDGHYFPSGTCAGKSCREPEVCAPAAELSNKSVPSVSRCFH